MNQDLEHLKLLTIFHYVVAGIMGLISCFPFIHLTMGIFLLATGDKFVEGGPHEIPPKIFGLMFTIISALFILTGWGISFCVFLAGRFLASRTHYTFCLVIACVMCTGFPFGTALGVFSIIVLIRPSVKEMFDANDFTHQESA